jgi:hypothetical protein
VNHGTNRNIPEWKRASHFNRRVDTGAHRITDLHTLGSDNITTLTIGVLDQRNVRRAVRIVFQALNCRRNTIFDPLKVDYAVVLLVATTNVAGSDATKMVATTRFTQCFQQRLVRAPLVKIRVKELNNVTAAGRCWLGFDDRHFTTPLPYSTSIKSMS